MDFPSLTILETMEILELTALYLRLLDGFKDEEDILSMAIQLAFNHSRED